MKGIVWVSELALASRAIASHYLGNATNDLVLPGENCGLIDPATLTGLQPLAFSPVTSVRLDYLN
jgi:hypothetical protein